MRKSTKLAILVAALVALCSLTALAADTWKQEGDQWFCYDKDGNPYYGVWKKSGANYYYLDDATGAMVTNSVIESDGEKYWVGEDGARVLNAWVKVPVENDGDGWEWMYFKALSGKAVKGDGESFTTIKNKEGVSKKYLFDTDGIMLYGYLTDMVGTRADSVLDAKYYMGTKEDGAQFTGWQKFVDGELGGDYAEKALVYFYFKNGKKITSADHNDDDQYKVSTGKYYSFQADGVLVTGYVYEGTNAYYLGAADDGLLKKKVWVKTSAIEDTGDSEYWYYLGSDGHPTAAAAEAGAQIKKVNGKYYLFSENGRMLTGVALMITEDELDPACENQALVARGWSTLGGFKGQAIDYLGGERFYYFSTDADADGSMKTGMQTVTIDGDEATVYFDKHGCALEGVVSKKIYNNGVLQAAGDSKFALAELRTHKTDDDAAYEGHNWFLVNAAGTIVYKTKVLDADGTWWVVDDEYNIFKFTGKDYAAQCATAFKAGKEFFKIGDTYYEIFVNEAKSVEGKYTFIDYAKATY